MPIDPLSWMRTLIGPDGAPGELLWWQMLARAFFVFVVAVPILRLGKTRMLGKNTAFDIVMGFILGSVLARAINGSAAFYPTLLSGAGLVLLHGLSAVLAFRSERVGGWVKGRASVLGRDGSLDEEALHDHHVTERDVEEALRLGANLASMDRVAEARMERNGEISVVPRDPDPRVVEVGVEGGVQTVRIELP